ncbi:hypothetical protein BCR43DRAFT_323626 [Syncephalastrum racemosum]|uniref:Uncharacterized protein n=1 Tax=Syncephalastrum racemosum TaxID=13706 RepID=A0A1X2H7L2_SYNRA|nr:hypothetical protein BCR43DRAFT_323626 [Syncephalastrum racemosum]
MADRTQNNQDTKASSTMHTEPPSLLADLSMVHFIRTAGAMLDVPARTVATALMYYHQFNRHMQRNVGRIDPQNDAWVDPSNPLYCNSEACERPLA